MSLIESDPARLVVNFHLAFNLAVALLFLPLVHPVAALAQRLLPDAPPAADASQPRHLDANVIDVPSEALACAMRETLNLGDRVTDMLRQALVALEKSDTRLVRDVEKADNAVDALHEAIKLYLVKVSSEGLTDEESHRYAEILTFTANLEHIGDIIDKNLMELASKKIKHRYEFSREGLEDIRNLHARVMDSMRLALNVFATRDVALARRLLAEKTAMRNAELAAAERHYARLREARPESIETSSIHLDVIRDLKRIHSHLTSVAYPILEPTGELQDSRLRAGEVEVSAERVAASRS
jgi:phosphate:Na+ symporter